MSEEIPSSFAELIRRAIESRLNDLHVSIPGQVQTYDSKSQTVDVLPMVKRPMPLEDGSYVFEKLPVIPHVRVSFPRSNAFSLTFPLSKGDEGMILMSMWDLSTWMNTGQVSEPGDLRLHHPSHSWFLPGVCSDPHVVAPDPGTDALVLAGPDVRLGSVSASNHAAVGEATQAWLDAIMTANAAGVGGVGVAIVPPVGPFALTSSTVATLVKVK